MLAIYSLEGSSIVTLGVPSPMPMNEAALVTEKLIKAADGPACEAFPQLHAALLRV